MKSQLQSDNYSRIVISVDADSEGEETFDLIKDIRSIAKKYYPDEYHLAEALRFFYKSITYDLMKDGISDMHCMSDAYLVEDLEEEYRNQ